MAALPPLVNLQAFEAVARRRSFALAATELHVTASAISHQVARLEADLGVRLFERSAHAVRLSTAGERYLERVAGALSAISAATEDLRKGVGNSLYVHSAPSIASLWLMPRLRGFAQAHPDIALNLSAAHTPSDFALGQADVDTRGGFSLVGTWRSRTHGQVSCSTRRPDRPDLPLPAMCSDSGPPDCASVFEILPMRRHGSRRAAGLLKQAQATDGPEAVGRCFTDLRGNDNARRLHLQRTTGSSGLERERWVVSDRSL